MNKRPATPTKPSLPQKIRTVLVAYAKTQLLLAISITVIFYFILSYLGVRFPIVIAGFSGAVSVIPVIGLWAAAILAATVAIFDNIRFLPNFPEFTEGIAVFFIYLFINLLIDYLVAPYLIGKTVKIHPLILLFSVMAGTAIFGLPGALLAVPATLIIKTIIDDKK